MFQKVRSDKLKEQTFAKQNIDRRLNQRKRYASSEREHDVTLGLHITPDCLLLKKLLFPDCHSVNYRWA